MSENKPNDGVQGVGASEGHSSEKEANFLARMLGMVVGKKQAGEAQPDVSRLAQRVKELGPDAANAAIDAAIASYSQKREAEKLKDESAKSDSKPE